MEYDGGSESFSDLLSSVGNPSTTKSASLAAYSAATEEDDDDVQVVGASTEEIASYANNISHEDVTSSSSYSSFADAQTDVFFKEDDDKVQIIGATSEEMASHLNTTSPEDLSNRSYSSFSNLQTDEISSDGGHCYRKMHPPGYSTYVAEKKLPGPMEEAMRSFCSDRSISCSCTR